MLGNPSRKTLWKHIVPNCIAPITFLSTLPVMTALLSESGLALLGLDVPRPIPTLRGMVTADRESAASDPWLVIRRVWRFRSQF